MKPRTLEALFPNPRARAAGDAAIDALPMTATLAEAVDRWEAEYERVAGKSPWRKK